MSGDFESNIGSLSNPFQVHDHLFNSAEDSRLAIKAILRNLLGSGFGDDTNDDYLMKGASVRLVENPLLDIEIKHRERIVIFYFKKPKGLSNQQADELESTLKREVSLQYASGGDDMRSRMALTVYRSLTEEGRQKLLHDEKQREQK